MPRGRVGNRSDLPGKVPIMTRPDQTYGNQTAQAQSQRILPIAAPPTAAPSGPAPQAAPQANPGLPQLPWISNPGHGLPVTHGRPYGPGAGPEALTGLAAQWHAQQQSETGTLSNLLKGLAQTPGATASIRQLASNAGAQ